MIGPSIPAHLLSKDDNKEQEQSQQREEDATPVLPEDEDDLADAFMPELPPDLLEPAPTPTTTTTTAAPAPAKRRTMGPQLPLAAAAAEAATSHYRDDDDDTIGPALPSQYDVDQAALSSTVAAIEERAKQSEQAMSKVLALHFFSIKRRFCNDLHSMLCDIGTFGRQKGGTTRMDVGPS